MKRTTLFKALLVGGMAISASSQLQAQPASLNANKIVQPYYKCWGLLTEGCPNAEKLGWKVGVQYHTFNKHTVFEAIFVSEFINNGNSKILLLYIS